MNKMGRKLIGLILLMGMTSATYTYGAVLHEIRTEETITRGAVHINDKLLMSKGWRNINILKVDLSDSNVSISPIESETGLQRQTVLQMVTDSGAVAGINADYFDMSTSNTPSLGMLIKNNTLSHGYNSNYSSLGINKNMATFMVDTSNTPSMEYYGLSIRINCNGTFIGGAASKNNISNSITRPIIVDRTYYQTTDNIVSNHPTVYTIVVENNQVTYLSKSGESVTIPQDGYVIIVPESIANEYYSKIKIGSTIEVQEVLYLNNGITQAVNTMKLGIGGSGLIMKNGTAYTGSAHTVSPKSNVARTIVATVKDTNEILLITIDSGSGYTGINHSELIELLSRYHVQDAMYLDGGGSTTFVSRNAGSFTPTLQNNPSDGAQRKVINGLGVFTTSATGSLDTLIMTASTERTFVGEPITFYTKGVDANSNPVSVDANHVTFSVTGGQGTFSGNTFTPSTAGKMLVIANYNGVEKAIEINVSEKPVGLLIEPSLIQVSENASKAVKVYGVDKEGYKIALKAEHVNWTSENSKIEVTTNTVVATSSAIGKITATYKDVTGTAGVIVGNTSVAIDSLETTEGKWAGNTSTVTGSVFPCTDPKYHGARSLKMTYTFKPSGNKQVAYTVFNTPISISQDARSVNMWLYGKKQGHTAKLEVVDSVGNTYYLKLTDSIDFTGWKYLSANLPAEMVLPAQITKFYVYANNVSETITTAVYMDHFSITRGFREGSGITTRTDYLYDPFYKASLQEPIGSQYIVNVVGPTRTDSMLLNNESISQISKKLSNGASLVLKASSKNSQLSLTPINYTYTNLYQAGKFNNTKFIMIGTTSGGIRTTDESGWLNMKTSIESSSTAKNIIIVVSRNPLTQFTDVLEGQAFHTYLKELRESTGKNIFVVYSGGTEPEVRIEDGIRYIRTNGINVVTDNYKEGSFIKFKMDGDLVYYTIEQFK
ncbi:MAG: phosphodiester glycosidase family protein [Candidatus Cellulosilyticum pullistercoris]|uniref:Phosphodiester glycosidase family protein n=1 Tax=Candidatus Cellulosilyticum pullistercoris TaxID=2838521 RepID=A0A9E2KDP2_9FIRM|nr:phosphodiester glycosidase family protein [Candidatus Cellulosilyticum pullistercoris]